MKLKILLLLMISSTINAQQRREQPVITTQIARVHLITENSDNIRNTQYIEMGNTSTPIVMQHFETIQRPVRHERKTIKSILYRNFIESTTAQVSYALLAFSLLGLAGLEPQNDRMHRFNQTVMCPSPDYYNVKNIAAIFDQGLCGFAGAGTMLCCMQCIKAGKECCDDGAEHQD